MQRLLCLVSAMDPGGAETFLIKIYRQLDREKYQMDFCVNKQAKGFYEEEIERLGGRIYRIPSKSENLLGFKNQLYNIVNKNKYQHVMRITSNAMGFMDLKIAKEAGANVCIARSSNSSDGGSIKSRIMHVLGQFMFDRYVDVKIAPSDLAAEYTFGKKKYRNGDVVILHNALDLNIYRFDREGRKRVRAELNIADDIKLIGHIGRFSKQKNHEFLIEIYREIHKKNNKTKLLLVGNGELEMQIKKLVHQYGLDNDIVFAGIRSDIPQILSAIDAFVFPSYYEGMPNTLIEAQATGLPCIIADTITRSADVTNNVTYLSLNALPEEWAINVLNKERKNSADIKKMMQQKGYDITEVVSKFLSVCFSL